MKGVTFTNRKGGSGKTSLSHALALGSAWCNTPAHVFHTDNRKPLSIKGRPYAYYDARETNTLQTLINSAINQDGLCIIDSGGNRPNFDKLIADCVDLALIPVTPDPEDVAEALEHYKTLEDYGAEHVRFIINRYPATANERQFVARYLGKLPIDKVIGYLPDVRAVRQLRESDEPLFLTPPSKVNNFARALYRHVMKELEETDTIEEPIKVQA